MKKMKFLSGFMMLVILGVFTSCDPLEEAVGPDLSFDGSGGKIAADATVDAGSTFTIKLTALSGDADLSNVNIKRVANNVPVTVLDSSLTKANESQISLTLEFEAMGTAGTESIIFTVTDADGETATYTIVITTTDAPGEINEFTAVLLGAQEAEPGSALDLETGVVYKSDVRDSYQAEIDLLFYYGISSGNQCTFVAPTHASVNGEGTNPFSWCEEWTTKNATKFKANIGMTTSQFDEITNDVEIKAVTEINDEIITKLQTGDVGAFVTAGGNKGVFKVVSITGTDGASTITIDVKVQK